MICNRIQTDVMNTLADDDSTKKVLLESMKRSQEDTTRPVGAREREVAQSNGKRNYY